MWGQSLQFWQTLTKVALWVAAGAGGISVVAGFLAGFIGYRVAAVVQVDADLRLAEARTRGDAANAAAAQAGEARALLQERVALLEQETATARLETEGLRAQMASRRILPAQADVLKSVLQQRRDRPIEITIRNQGSDPETMQYASDIADVLTGAGLAVHKSTTLVPGKQEGLYLGAPIDSADFQLIGRAFNEAGIEFAFAGIVPTLTLYVNSQPR